jgi:SAM-dependent methyltransferase
MTNFRKPSLEGFQKPTATPSDPDQARLWQEANRHWWEDHPMRYDWNQQIGKPEFSRDFFQEIDRRFFDGLRQYMPWNSIPLDPLVDFGALAARDVLEIGVGMGTHAQVLASHARSYSGIDLTEYAANATRLRMQCFGIDGRILRMDAEHLGFQDASFDFVWSWGVIHHSSSTRTVLQEIHRVLRPGGQTVLMVYHRGWWNYYLMGTLFAVMGGNFPSGARLHQAVQRHTDGALARYYSAEEFRECVSGLFDVSEMRVFGQKGELIPLPGGLFKRVLLRLLPNSAARGMANNCRMGTFLVARLRKR